MLSLLTALTLASCTVTDGDTIRCGTERIRLVSIDTAEIRGKCPTEKALAIRARDRLRELLQEGFEVERTGKDRFGRTLGRVSVNGRDIGQQLVEEGLAREWRGRRLPWC